MGGRFCSSRRVPTLFGGLALVSLCQLSSPLYVQFVLRTRLLVSRDIEQETLILRHRRNHAFRALRDFDGQSRVLSIPELLLRLLVRHEKACVAISLESIRFVHDT